jgi:metallo-beta-lactamase family protein
MQITVFGGAGTVTGSKHFVEHEGARVLVDCGLFQGVKVLRERNWRPFPFSPDTLDAVFLTHAHIDHSGMLPALVRDGFAGPIFCTPATADVAEILLRDSARLHEEDARYADRKGFSRHRPAKPLYTEADAERALRRLRPVELNAASSVGPFTATFREAGHILGAAHLGLSASERTVVLSGDLGRRAGPLMHPPAPPPAADLIVMESTYGNRLHAPGPEAALADIVDRTFARGGILLIPAFAVGRTQSLLFHIDQILDARGEPRPPTFVNSPMATSVTGLYRRHRAHLRLDEQGIDALRDATFVRSVEESKALNGRRGPMVVISASGMLTGGRVLHHLKAFAPDEKNTVLLSGFQAPGTRGARLLSGERTIKIHGANIPVRAEVAQIDGLSAHADQAELLAWLRSAEAPPKQVLLNHGEPAVSDVLRTRIQDELGIPARVAEEGVPVELAG